MKFFKISLTIVLVLIGVFIAVAGVFIATFDANEYKPLISEQVKQQTGRDFSLGDIKPSVFPWLGLELKQISLMNAKGFKAEKMLQIERLDVRVELMPLIRQELRVDTLRVHGLQASLEKNKNGRTNWDDILEKQAAAPTSTAKPLASPSTEPSAETSQAAPESTPLALLINGVEIKGANINWHDATAKQTVLLENLNVNTGAIRQGKPLPVKLSSQVTLAEPQVSFNINTETSIDFDPQTQKLKLQALALNLHAALKQSEVSQASIALTTQLDADLKAQLFSLPSFSLDINVAGDGIPNKKLKLDIRGGVDVDLQKQTASVNKLNINTLGLSMQSQLAVAKLIDAPQLNGSFELKEFNPSTLAKSLAIELPETSSKAVLQSASLNFSFTANEQSANLGKVELKLDKTRVSASASVVDFAKPKINYSLKVDSIVLDDYLAPPVVLPAGAVDANAPTTATAVKKDIPIDLPIALLKTLNVKGDVNVSSLKAFDQTISNLQIKTLAKGGVIKVSPVKAKVLQGTINSTAQLDVRKNTPRYQFTLQAARLKADSVVNPLLQDMLGEKSVSMSGAVNINTNIKSKGSTVNQLIANSNGQFKLNMGKSKLHGVDAEYFVLKAVEDYLQAKNLPVPAQWKAEYKPKETTALTVARASAVIRNGVIENKDLLLDSSRLKVTGAGKIHLPRELLDYRIVVDVKPGRTKTVAERLLDKPMPVFVKGSFAKPAISIDEKAWKKSLGKEIKAEAKKEIKQAVKKEKKKQQEKLKKKADKKLDKAKDKVKDKLKGLFGR